jgi:hypothetical protein
MVNALLWCSVQQRVYYLSKSSLDIRQTLCTQSYGIKVLCAHSDHEYSDLGSICMMGTESSEVLMMT